MPVRARNRYRKCWVLTNVSFTLGTESPRRAPPQLVTETLLSRMAWFAAHLTLHCRCPSLHDAPKIHIVDGAIQMRYREGM